MLRTVIVDDEPIIRADIEKLLQSMPDVKVAGACGSVRDAVTLIATLKPDLVLLDIQLSDGNSFEIIDALPGLDCAVVFITAFDQHAIRAIRVGALDYLLKPVDEEELYEAIEKARRKTGQGIELQAQAAQRSLNNRAPDDFKHIMLSSQTKVEQVALSDIVFCEGDGNYTTFYLAKGRKIVASRPLKEYDELFPHPQFIRTHQSYLVNRHYISLYDRDGMIRLKDGRTVPVAVRKKEMVLALLNNNTPS